MITLITLRTLVPAFFLFFLSSTIGAQCTNPDYGGLEKFYLATNGDDWDNNRGWLTDCEPCGWEGIECDAAGRVVTILLRDNNLTGTLPLDFGGLTELSFLAIPRNKVGGGLPPALFTLTSLRDLNLSHNQFVGALSSDITQLSSIEYLRLGRNQLTGSLPADLADCVWLKHIEMEDNHFSGPIPAGLGDLIDLKVISFSNNDLEGCFPQDLATVCGRIRASFGGNTKLSWEGDFSQLCLSEGADVVQIGAPCNDGDPNTVFDVITERCDCAGTQRINGIVFEEASVEGFTELNETGTVERFVRSGLAPVELPGVMAASSRLTAFPNPLVGGTLNVRIPESMSGAEVRLLSLNGREITRNTNVHSGFSLSVPVLEAGIYLLEAVSGDERSITRVIVQ